MTRHYLSIPAGSVPAERLSSRAGDIITKKLNRLGDRTANILLLVENWIGQPDVEEWEREDEVADWVNGCEWAPDEDDVVTSPQTSSSHLRRPAHASRDLFSLRQRHLTTEVFTPPHSSVPYLSKERLTAQKYGHEDNPDGQSNGM
ncbi:hypothetical protein FN846DRAFT_903994 [Sphaerosporella brunnea]|uniref:HAT C-terminal dimerisation domain-containing protein n=1 Tax=Sphaerosporella brunnea TaxID=1250544 RepID=A0A5J5F654_9PEZI|nr:hypothetical protein FN846DRAFT_903994 [Sphaerosporella brunnea]